MEITDKEMQQFENELCEAIRLVSKDWPLSKFKRFVSQFLRTTNDEDQWTFDYESYALAMHRSNRNNINLHPMNWAPEHFFDRWDNEKFNESLESLRKIATKENKK
jgi:hypothetical protein